MEGEMKGKASSYGDEGDRQRYRKRVAECIAKGMSQEQAEAEGRKVGDPGLGWLGNDITDISIPWVAVPRDCWVEKWTTKRNAHRRRVLVTISGVTRECVLGDTMPWLKNIKNGAVVDLAPGALQAFGLKAPCLVPASWTWANEDRVPPALVGAPPSPPEAPKKNKKGLRFWVRRIISQGR